MTKIFRSQFLKIASSFEFQYLLQMFILSFFYVYIEFPLGSSRRELHFWATVFGFLTYSGVMTKNLEVYDQYLFCPLHFSICSHCKYRASSRETKDVVFRSYNKKFQINICFLVCILVFGPNVYIELTLSSSIFVQQYLGILHIQML